MIVGQVGRQLVHDVRQVLVDGLVGVGHKRVPDAHHRHLDAGNRIELVTVQLRENLRQIRLQLKKFAEVSCSIERTQIGQRYKRKPIHLGLSSEWHRER